MLLTSPLWKVAFTPLLEIISSSFLTNSSSKISFTPISAPSFANVIAMPRPIPFLAPVIRTFLPSSNPIGFSSKFSFEFLLVRGLLNTQSVKV